jgi:hypothetical protein
MPSEERQTKWILWGAAIASLTVGLANLIGGFSAIYLIAHMWNGVPWTWPDAIKWWWVPAILFHGLFWIGVGCWIIRNIRIRARDRSSCAFEVVMKS